MARNGRQQPQRVAYDNRDGSLLDLVDNLLNKGVLLNGELTISLAHVDLVYARLSVLLCAADFLLPSGETQVRARLRGQREAREQIGRA
jgi:hypothetical protein